MNNITTRTAVSEDKDFLKILKFVSMRQYVESVYGWDDAVQDKFFEDSFYPDKIQIIRYNNQNVGMYELQERNEYCFLVRIEILPAFQSKGIGTTIIHQIVEYVSKTGKPLRLQVFKVNPAQKLYQRIGFIATGETDTHIAMELFNPTDFLKKLPDIVTK